MKCILWLAGCLLLIVIMLGAAGCDGITSPPARTSSGGVVSSQSTGIWVNGEGKVTVTPDVAILSLGVEAQADTVDQAQSEASTAMNAVISELVSRGVAGKDIKTQYFSIYPVRNWVPDTGEEELAGYRVTNMVTVKIKILPQESYTLDYKAGNIVDAVAKAGGNYIRIDNISFTVDDPAPYQKEAREKALADARDEAEQIAKAANVRLGEPTYINESSSYYPTPFQTSYGMGVPVPAPAPELAASISSGETEITVIVQVAYSIE